MRYRTGTTAALIVATSLLAACGDEDPTEPEATACTPATGTVTATVGSGTSPQFDWDPACAVALVLVEGSGGDTWIIGTDDATWSTPEQANLIEPPVTYGAASLPVGVQTEYGPDPLVAGTTYDLILFSVVDASSTCPDLLGTNVCRLTIHEFTP